MKTQGNIKVVAQMIAVLLFIFSIQSFGKNKIENVTESVINANIHYMLAQQLQDSSDYSGAINEINRSIELNPGKAELYDFRGILYTKLIKYNKAIKDFNEAAKLNPNEYEIYNHRGIVYYLVEDYNNSIKDYSKAIELYNDYGKAYLNRAITELMQNNETDALADMIKASNLNIKEADEFLAKNNLMAQN
jgi:Flp pilus assembly protein TadD